MSHRVTNVQKSLTSLEGGDIMNKCPTLVTLWLSCLLVLLISTFLLVRLATLVLPLVFALLVVAPVLVLLLLGPILVLGLALRRVLCLSRLWLLLFSRYKILVHVVLPLQGYAEPFLSRSWQSIPLINMNYNVRM